MINLLKLNYGFVEAKDGTQEEDVIVKSLLPNTLRDGIIGGVITLAGIGYLLVTAFKHGADSYQTAEYGALDKLDLLG